MAPHRPDRMNDVACGQAISSGDLRGAGVAAVQGAAFLKQLRSGRPVDRAVDASATEERAVCRVDNSVDLKGRDVGDHDVEPCAAMADGLQGERERHWDVSSMHEGYAHSACASARRSN